MKSGTHCTFKLVEMRCIDKNCKLVIDKGHMFALFSVKYWFNFTLDYLEHADSWSVSRSVRWTMNAVTLLCELFSTTCFCTALILFKKKKIIKMSLSNGFSHVFFVLQLQFKLHENIDINFRWVHHILQITKNVHVNRKPHFCMLSNTCVLWVLILHTIRRFHSKLVNDRWINGKTNQKQEIFLTMLDFNTNLYNES